MQYHKDVQFLIKFYFKTVLFLKLTPVLEMLMCVFATHDVEDVIKK